MTETLVPTRYMSSSCTEDGTLILFNALTGAIGAVPPDQAKAAQDALKRTVRHCGPLNGIVKDLKEGGFLIPEDMDEAELVRQYLISRYSDDYLHLIIMPTEECNFRCVYCYESFSRGKMPAQVRESIKRYVAYQGQLKRLQIVWFGGEPLLAADVVIELSQFFFQHCSDHGIEYLASMSTNGSLLTPEIVEQIVPYGVRFFQITLDGIREEHNKRRVFLGGGDTFDTIMENLRYLKNTNYTFIIALRHNFDPENLETLEDFINMLKVEFGDDPRFTTTFQPICKWGGPNDLTLSVCEGRSVTRAMIRAQELAVKAGFRNTLHIQQFRPFGYVCYAALPRSFVIGSDGTIYKCTVELDYHDRNIIGHLHADGTMELNWHKMALWCEAHGMQEGKKCVNCFFAPVCYGAVCPKQWLDKGDCECPHEKIAIRDTLVVMLKESELPETPELSSVAQCTKG